MSFLRIQNLYKRFEQTVAVDHINLDIQSGEFFTLLGSSGCGKTTTLRMVGGLEKPEGGTIYLGERCLVSSEKHIFIAPENRDMGMVFQSYALWPHMTVFENVSYPLRLRGVGRAQMRVKVAEVLRLVGLAGLEDRPAPALSGGQQQRVALARALVFSPNVLLLDEPLSNLDAQLREEMRRELKALQQRVNVTVLFVTHDQVEALSLSDRIAIMKFGVLEQVGTPREVYYEPATPFVRDFLGKSFLLLGKVSTLSDHFINVQVDGLAPACLTVQRAMSLIDGLTVGQPVTVATRPEQIELWGSPPDGQCNLISGYLEAIQFLGDQYEYTVKIGSDKHVLASPGLPLLQTGAKIFLRLKPESITIWPGKA